MLRKQTFEKLNVKPLGVLHSNTSVANDTIQLCSPLQQAYNTCVHCPIFHEAFMPMPLWQIKPFLKLFLCLFSTPLPNCVVVFIISNMNAKKLARTMQHKKYFYGILFLLQFLSVVSFWKSFYVDHKVHKFIIMKIITNSVKKVIFVQNVCESG